MRFTKHFEKRVLIIVLKAFEKRITKNLETHSTCILSFQGVKLGRGREAGAWA